MDEDFELTVGGRTYHSLDELSPELREKLGPYLEKARAAKAAAGPVLGSGDSGRKLLFWLVLLVGALFFFLRLRGR